MHNEQSPPSDLQQLKALALAADGLPENLQPFVSVGGHVAVLAPSLSMEQAGIVAEFYDRASPAVVLDLIARIERLTPAGLTADDLRAAQEQFDKASAQAVEAKTQLEAARIERAAAAAAEVRCQCCGYLVTESEHKGCLRAASPATASGDELKDFDNYFCMTLSCDGSESEELVDACRAAAADAWMERGRRTAVSAATKPTADLRAALQTMVDRFGPMESEYLFSKRDALRVARNALAGASPDLTGVPQYAIDRHSNGDVHQYVRVSDIATKPAPLDLEALQKIADRVDARGLFNASCDIREWIASARDAIAASRRAPSLHDVAMPEGVLMMRVRPFGGWLQAAKEQERALKGNPEYEFKTFYADPIAAQPAEKVDVAMPEQVRKALQDVTDVLDIFGNLGDGQMCPAAWRAAKAEDKIKAARDVLAAQPAEGSVQFEPIDCPECGAHWNKIHAEGSALVATDWKALYENEKAIIHDTLMPRLRAAEAALSNSAAVVRAAPAELVARIRVMLANAGPAAVSDGIRTLLNDAAILIAAEGATQGPEHSDTPAGPKMLPLSAGLPSPDKHYRVIVYTDGVDFAGQQYFDVKTEHLWELDEDSRDEVAGAATHWMPHPARIDGDKQGAQGDGK